MTAVSGTPERAATEYIQSVPHIRKMLVSFFTQIVSPDVLLGLLFVTNFDTEAALTLSACQCDFVARLCETS
jgi:hypothetical protein